jgi:drug/metabolite transporter (DMT)-like permease
MPMAWKGLLVGGLLPALLFGATGILQKVYGRAGGGSAPYLLLVGAGVALAGALGAVLQHDRALPGRAAVAAVAIGLTWGLGMIAVMAGLQRFGTPLAKLAPLYNLNTLIVVLLALVVFAESRDVNVARLLSGTVFIIAGATLVVRA